jgi:type IV secretion system protein VirB10
MSDHRDDEELDDEVEPVPFWRRRKVQYTGLAVVLLLAFVFTRGKPTHEQDPEKTAGQYIGVVVPYQPVKAEEPAAPGPGKATDGASTSPPPPAPESQPPAAPAFRIPTPPGMAAKPIRPAMLSYVVHTDPPRSSTASPPPEPPQTGLTFKASDLPGLKASPAIDDTYMLMPGLLPCVLDTAIQSDLPGPLLCHLPGPVYSPKGVLLMEAETQVIGRYESMKTNGGSRLMAVSTYAHTPNGIWVPLAGNPLSDDLGRTGLDGAVNNHYVQRFGGAVILTLTEGALGILQADISKGGNTYVSLNDGSGVGGLAQQILQSQINIAPTFTKHQGETIAIWLAEPIDFSDSYKIRQVRQ